VPPPTKRTRGPSKTGAAAAAPRATGKASKAAGKGKGKRGRPPGSRNKRSPGAPVPTALDAATRGRPAGPSFDYPLRIPPIDVDALDQALKHPAMVLIPSQFQFQKF